jgi:regulator of sigma E protease
MDLLFTIASFIVALAILIAVHEFGHFWVARRLGVKVLRFSIGFGKPLLRHQRDPESTEYVLAGIPLGGYVKMLDEREEPVPEAQRHLAFNNQVLWKRSAIVAAGPVFNFLFAILAYWGIFLAGDTGLRPVVGTVEPASIAERAGFQPGDELLRIGARPSPTWEGVVFALMSEALDGRDLEIGVRTVDGDDTTRRIDGATLSELSESPNLLDRLGLAPDRPRLPAVIGELSPGEPASEVGFQSGDLILAVDGMPITSWGDWVDLVRASPGQGLKTEVEREGRRLELTVTPRPFVLEDGTEIGRIGAGVQPRDDLMDSYRVEIHHGPLSALGAAVDKTADMSVVMLRVIWRMLIGQASVENLSGPITIAETAGKTASFGLDYFVKFLAVVSISLGVLNLLPIPVLDGGHLLYFLIEWVKGSPLSEQAQMQGQKVGLLMLAALMTLAFYVDLTRLFGS